MKAIQYYLEDSYKRDLPRSTILILEEMEREPFNPVPLEEIKSLSAIKALTLKSIKDPSRQDIADAMRRVKSVADAGIAGARHNIGRAQEAMGSASSEQKQELASKIKRQTDIWKHYRGVKHSFGEIVSRRKVDPNAKISSIQILKFLRGALSPVPKNPGESAAFVTGLVSNPIPGMSIAAVYGKRIGSTIR